jgi:epoxyqueuosine reductase
LLVPSEPYDYWDEENKTGKGLVSLKHIAHKCGLGSWGKNHLLYNSSIGSLMKIGAILTDAILDSDKIQNTQICKEGCELCISSCPTGALNSSGVEQKKCRQFSQGKTLKDEPIYSCNLCRKVCPNVYGFTSNEISAVYLNNNN